MLKKFIPYMYQKDIYNIDYNKLKNENIKCILFDLDNTISPAREIVLDKKIKKLFDELKKDFIIVLFSNNTKKRVSFFASYYETEFLHMSVKPLPFSYRKMIRKYHLNKNYLVAVGDQLITDIFGGNLIGIKTILVDPVSKEDEKITFLNRKLEGMIFNKFKKKNILIKGKYYE